jgi:hypothetical protein
MPRGRKTKLLALALVPLRGGASLADTFAEARRRANGANATTAGN